MTFDSIWPRLMIPGEFDSMDECDQLRWKSVLQQAYDMGRDEAAITRALEGSHEQE